MKIANCRSCRAEIVWLVTPKGKKMPIDADYMALRYDMDEAEPAFSWEAHHEGVHWGTCPNANEHRKPR